MANLASQLDSWNPIATWSVSAGTSSGIANKKLVPRTLAGAIIDCTTYTSASLVVSQSGPFYPDAVATYPLTVVSGDNTGIVVSATPAEAIAALSGNFKSSTPCFVTMTDGTNTVQVAQGNLSAILLP